MQSISQLFTFSSALGAGDHKLDVYGQEGCCDGATGGEYSVNGGAFTPFATTVPEPAALLFGFGGLLSFGSLAIRRLRK